MEGNSEELHSVSEESVSGVEVLDVDESEEEEEEEFERTITDREDPFASLDMPPPIGHSYEDDSEDSDYEESESKNIAAFPLENEGKQTKKPMSQKAEEYMKSIGVGMENEIPPRPQVSPPLQSNHGSHFNMFENDFGDDTVRNLNNAQSIELNPPPVIGGMVSSSQGTRGFVGRATSPKLLAQATHAPTYPQMNCYKYDEGVPVLMGVIESEAGQNDFIRKFFDDMPQPGEGRMKFAYRPVDINGREADREWSVHISDTHTELKRIRKMREMEEESSEEESSEEGFSGMFGSNFRRPPARQRQFADGAQRMWNQMATDSKAQAEELKTTLEKERERVREMEKERAQERVDLAINTAQGVQSISDRMLDAERLRQQQSMNQSKQQTEMLVQTMSTIHAQQNSMQQNAMERQQSADRIRIEQERVRAERERMEMEERRRRDREEAEDRRKRELSDNEMRLKELEERRRIERETIRDQRERERMQLQEQRERERIAEERKSEMERQRWEKQMEELRLMLERDKMEQQQKLQSERESLQLKLAREREETERREKMYRDEREARERREREERDAKEKRDRDERDRRDREWQERKDREKQEEERKERLRQERLERERAERDRKEQLERERLEREETRRKEEWDFKMKQMEIQSQRDKEHQERLLQIQTQEREAHRLAQERQMQLEREARASEERERERRHQSMLVDLESKRVQDKYSIEKEREHAERLFSLQQKEIEVKGSGAGSMESMLAKGAGLLGLLGLEPVDAIRAVLGQGELDEEDGEEGSGGSGFLEKLPDMLAALGPIAALVQASMSQGQQGGGMPMGMIPQQPVIPQQQNLNDLMWQQQQIQQELEKQRTHQPPRQPNIDSFYPPPQDVTPQETEVVESATPVGVPEKEKTTVELARESGLNMSQQKQARKGLRTLVKKIRATEEDKWEGMATSHAMSNVDILLYVNAITVKRALDEAGSDPHLTGTLIEKMKASEDLANKLAGFNMNINDIPFGA